MQLQLFIKSLIYGRDYSKAILPGMATKRMLILLLIQKLIPFHLKLNQRLLL